MPSESRADADRRHRRRTRAHRAHPPAAGACAGLARRRHRRRRRGVRAGAQPPRGHHHRRRRRRRARRPPLRARRRHRPSRRRRQPERPGGDGRDAAPAHDVAGAARRLVRRRLRPAGGGRPRAGRAVRRRLVGGNITRSRGPLVVDVTAIGSVHRRRILRRSGARAGDYIVVSGMLGDARAGLALLSGSAGLDADTGPDAVARYLHPEPRLRLGQMLGRRAGGRGRRRSQRRAGRRPGAADDGPWARLRD